ncbi:MAG: hypothetical protein M3Q33_07920, partial [Acidobacteriota bacterium]|nr:hypothetical protein [Acidobacteriota bacterium]
SFMMERGVIMDKKYANNITECVLSFKDCFETTINTGFHRFFNLALKSVLIRVNRCFKFSFFAYLPSSVEK